MVLNVVLFGIGIAMLYYGGEWLVEGSSTIAKKYRVPPFIIGAVIIGFGTSAPEAFVSIMAQLKGSSGLSFGNIVGSSICNLALILGVTALICPIPVEAQILKRGYPFLMVVTLIVFGLAFARELGRVQAIVCLVLFSLFLIWSVRQAQSAGEQSVSEDKHGGMFLWLEIVGGIIVLIGGSELLVRSGVSMARAMGVSELVIGSSLVAVGTSLPELAAGLVAARKREHGLLLGNIVGSNLFNLLFVLGIALFIGPIPVEAQSIQLLLPGLLVFTLALYPMLRSGRLLDRKEAALLLIGYGVFVVFLFAMKTA